MSVQFKQKEISTRERLNELDGLPAQVADNYKEVSDKLVPLSGYTGKNVLINGDISVWQRGDTLGPQILATGFFADRFTVNANSPGSHTITKITDVPEGFSYGFNINAPAIENRWAFSYAVEDIYAMNLSGKEVTLSFYARARVGSISSIYTFDDNTVKRGSAELTSEWQRFEYTFTVSMVNGVKTFVIRFDATLAAGVSALDADFTGFQLEVGSEATPFEIVDPATQLARCQRYGVPIIPGHMSAGMRANTNKSYINIYTPVQLRRDPDFTGSIDIVTRGSGYDNIDTITSFNFILVNQGGVIVEFTTAINVQTTESYTCRFTNTVNAFLSAEL